MSFLLRVILPDKPGSLGAVATALGNAGADILGVDVVERADGHAIDDLAVELPPGRPPDVLMFDVISSSTLFSRDQAAFTSVIAAFQAVLASPLQVSACICACPCRDTMFCCSCE